MPCCSPSIADQVREAYAPITIAQQVQFADGIDPRLQLCHTLVVAHVVLRQRCWPAAHHADCGWRQWAEHPRELLGGNRRDLFIRMAHQLICAGTAKVGAQ